MATVLLSPRMKSRHWSSTWLLIGCGFTLSSCAGARTQQEAEKKPPGSQGAYRQEVPQPGGAGLGDAAGGDLGLVTVSVAPGARRGAKAAGRGDAGSVAVDQSGCPEEMARVGEVCVDRWEAHLVVQSSSGAWEKHPYFERPPADQEYRAKSAAGEKPQGYISRVESAKACANAGKRLCTADEWLMTCSGTRRTTYPYGSKFEKATCNVSKKHLLSWKFGADPRGWKYQEHFNSPLLNQIEGGLAKAGEYEGCRSDYGVYDMVGNLHEWVEDDATSEVARAVIVDPAMRRALTPRKRGRGVFMGGFYSTLSEHGDGCNFITMAHEPAYHDYSTGFRCCMSP